MKCLVKIPEEINKIIRKYLEICLKEALKEFVMEFPVQSLWKSQEVLLNKFKEKHPQKSQEYC